MTNYREALEAAGATLLDFGEFGTWEGNWIAHLADGRFVEGAFGSCSGCDAFESEFGLLDYGCDAHCRPNEICGECAKKAANYARRLAIFGQTYLDSAEDYESIRQRFLEQSEWDYDAKEAVAWLDRAMEETR